jgi:SAM-dependent methyltransferase
MNQHIREMPSFGWQLLSGQRSAIESRFAQLRAQDIQQYSGSDNLLRILDIANGRLRPQYALLRHAGHQVYGVDYINRSPRTPTDLAYTVARQMYNWRSGFMQHQQTNTLVCGDVGKLPFASGFFDLATSVAAFEHFLEVPHVIDEIQRVLRPGGLAWICIHIFTSPSGGHNVRLLEVPLRTLPSGTEPWDHLRQRRLPFTVPLNEWRIQQYLDAFQSRFEIIKSYCAIREGEQWLTPAIEAELSQYSRDELTCAAFVIVARKPG